MLKNDLPVAIRNVRRCKGYIVVNFDKLVVEAAVCLLIPRYVEHALGYDLFHEKRDDNKVLSASVTGLVGSLCAVWRGGAMRGRLVGVLLIGFLALAVPTEVEAQTIVSELAADSYSVVPTADVQVDGVLDEAAWQRAQPIPLPFEVSPGDNLPARVETTCFVAFDDANLYLACDARDTDPDRIRAFITDRDDIFAHDNIGFVVDPFNDGRRAFVFSVNALGVQLDGILDELQGFDVAWDAIWNSAGRRTPDGFSVEVAIPFKSLRFPATDAVQTWSFYLWRHWPRSESVVLESRPVDRNNACYLCQSNRMTGIRGVAPGRNLELTPTFTSRRTDRREGVPNGPLEPGRVDSDAGLDLRWGITSDLTLNVALNPDFSQVEADAAQLDVNNTFALRFPEKRPFFLEGADLFGTPLEAVFTRSIADPLVGTKLTGKLGRNAVGAIVARDRVTNLIFPGSFGSSSATLDQEATTLIGRFRRDLGASSTIGALVTGREGAGYSNRVGGVDGFFRPFGPVTARVQYLHAETTYPDTVAVQNDQQIGRFGGDAFRAQVEYETRHWEFDTNYESVSSAFRADAGFMTLAGVRRLRLNATRLIWGRPDSWFTRLRFWAAYWFGEDEHGHAVDAWRVLSGQYTGPLQSDLGVFVRWRRQFFEGVTYTIFSPFISFEIRPSGNLFFRLGTILGNNIDFANARQADRVQLNPQVGVRLMQRVDLQVEHTFDRFKTEGQEIFTANLSEGRLVYHFNPRTFVRAIVQYRHTRRNLDVYVDEVDRVSESVFTQLLFSYKLNPQSVVFVGYSGTLSGATDAAFVETPLTQMDRTVFLKLGYAWRP